MAIELHDFKNKLVSVYDNNDKLICKTMDEYKFLDILCQINEQELEDYYIILDGERYEISKSGHVRNSPKELFPYFNQLLERLMGF